MMTIFQRYDDMTIDRIRSNIANRVPRDLFRTVPVQPTPAPRAVDVPGVLDQTRRLYQPYTGTTDKDNK